MTGETFRVLVVDLDSGRGRMTNLEGKETVAGGSGLAALLFEKYGHRDRPWDDPDQPLIFAVGPLTGYFPLMSKTVLAFKSPTTISTPKAMPAGVPRSRCGLRTSMPWWSAAGLARPRASRWGRVTWN